MAKVCLGQKGKRMTGGGEKEQEKKPQYQENW